MGAASAVPHLLSHCASNISVSWLTVTGWPMQHAGFAVFRLGRHHDSVAYPPERRLRHHATL
ncbi:hypothetical protein BBG7_0830 [Bifidobacterium longum]|jgi:hypothetical protein|uniref:Uncharacterized protein n=1 Tax=Bifidobacterium longum subsp. infantis CCUG 52486 TaxID=537937 RepID=C5EAL8_BIFLI|nr:hypothetical protein BBG7_0830 [Bifidobacterium longum]EEQ55062.1 hypothetical protein BLIG_01013 [Bifidobacterium longum subsp. infantis CCUG 52486]EPE39310.1 hypothetical protein I118_0836 [Bifidobacterium longum D2957]